MATQVQFRRGTTVQHSSFTGAVGEITVDVDKNTLVVHDGSTVGGHPLSVSGATGTFDDLNVGGDLVVTGNLTVNGDTTTLNTATLSVEDLNITVAQGAASAAAANGAGLTVDGANATILYQSSGDKWVFNKSIDLGSNSITTTGTITAPVSVSTFILGGTTVTATAAELNVLDGMTASTSELNVLDGMTASTAELNLLDGVTATTTELNYVDGVTGNIQTQLDSKVAKAGDTMTGFLTLSANPTSNLHAATKQYVDSVVAGKDSLSELSGTTDDLTEGSTKLFFTNARARSAISAGGDLSYDSGTGVMSFSETYSTPSELLTAIKTVDGTGSGLDADTLDGQHLSDLDNRYVNVSGDSMTGNITTSGLVGGGSLATKKVIEVSDDLDGWVTTNPIAIITGGSAAYDGRRIEVTVTHRGQYWANAVFYHYSAGTTAGDGSLYRAEMDANSGSIYIQAKFDSSDNKIEIYSNITTSPTSDTVCHVKALHADSGSNVTITINPGASVLVSPVDATDTTGAYQYRYGITKFGDNDKAYFGDGNDLQIYHDGSNSYVQDSGTGYLILGGANTGVIIREGEGNDLLKTSATDIQLGYEDSIKLATTSTGIDVTGTVTANRGIGDTQTASISGTYGPNFTSYQNFIYTLVGATTLDNPSTHTVGESGFIVFKQDGTGGRTVSLSSYYKTVGGAGLTLSSSPNAVDVVPYIVVSSTQILLGQPQLAFA